MPGSKSDLAHALVWLVTAGSDEAILEEPVNRLVPPPTVSSAGPRPAQTAVPSTAHVTDFRTRPAAPSDLIGRAMEMAASCNTLQELRTALESFEGCPLKRFATKTVFADGTPDCRIMFVGEAPGREEDLAGLPFVGRAGKLLDKMLAAIGLDRKSNVYITNVLNWRPPDNRDPTPEEAASCLPFLRRHIELVSPEVMVLLGAVATRHVMGKSDGIMRLRGNWLEYHVGGRRVPVMPTLHPAYLLRRPIDKKLAWRDLQQISVKVNSLGILEQRAQRS